MAGVGGREKQQEGRREGRREERRRMENEREKGQLWLPGEQEQLRVFYEVPGWSPSTHASSALSAAPC